MSGDSVNFTVSGACSECGRYLPRLREIGAQYFDGKEIKCSKCGEIIDLWQCAQRFARANTGFVGLQGVGAENTLFLITIKQGETKFLDFRDFGVPADATVLAVNYTPHGAGCFPIEVWGNAPRRRFPGPKVTLYGMPFKDQGETETSVGVLVTWIQDDRSAEGWLHLIDAFDAVASGRLTHMIVPAQSAVEIALASLLTDLLERHISKTAVEDFMADGVTYSGILNVLLPFICGERGVCPMPTAVRGELNRLRKLRNKFVHEGFTPDTFTASDAGQLLCGAAFGFEFVRHIRSKLIPLAGA